MTASIHPLGNGASAGAYYTNDPYRETHNRDEYYALDGGGVWWSSGSSVVRHDAAIDLASFRDLCAGRDPRSGKGLVRVAGEGHRAGWDITFSAPKSFSILYASGDEAQRARLAAIQAAAVDEALRFLAEEKLIEVRLGAGGKYREAAQDLMIGRFAHYTSRAGDPNVHTHCVLMNVAGSRDGNYRTLEPKQAYDWLHCVGAAYRVGLSTRLHQEFDFVPRSAGRGQFEIQGIPETLIEAFSKRSRELEATLSGTRAGASAAQKEVAALSTRGAKADVPTGPALEARWQTELREHGIDPWAAARALDQEREQVPEQAPDLTFDPPEIEGRSPVALAASALFRHENVLDRKALMERGLMEAALQSASIDAVREEIKALERSGTLLRLPSPDHDPRWTTPAIAAAEAALIRAAERQAERQWFDPKALRDALEQAQHLTEEQRAAVEHAASRDGVSVIEAGAGTGKTTLAKALVDAARRSGLTVVGLAPSWVAADELAKSIGIKALALAKWRHDEAMGRGSALSERHLVIIDEAGMAGTRDLAAVLEKAAEVRAKVVLVGDRTQLASVAGASALRAVVDVVGRHATLTQVRRQQVDWQRAASTLMARGDVEAGLRAYGQRSGIELVAGSEAAQARVIDLWCDARTTYGNREVLMLTRRNRDAAALNQAARDKLRDEGIIQGEDVVISALDREGETRSLSLAQGDAVRFGETLAHHGIRNGTRAVVDAIESTGEKSRRLRVRLEDGRIVEDDLGGFARQVPGRKTALIPRLVHAYAGTIYSAQGRTAEAAIMYIATPTDARELYVGMTRHTKSMTLVAERDRLDAACRSSRSINVAPSTAVMQERLFVEARRYSEKRNVVDFVEDRAAFARTGTIPPARPEHRIDLPHAFEAGRALRAVLQQLGDGLRLAVPQLRHLVRDTERVLSTAAAQAIDKMRNRSLTRSPARGRGTVDRGPDLSP